LNSTIAVRDHDPVGRRFQGRGLQSQFLCLGTELVQRLDHLAAGCVGRHQDKDHQPHGQDNVCPAINGRLVLDSAKAFKGSLGVVARKVVNQIVQFIRCRLHPLDLGRNIVIQYIHGPGKVLVLQTLDPFKFLGQGSELRFQCRGQLLSFRILQQLLYLQ